MTDTFFLDTRYTNVAQPIDAQWLKLETVVNRKPITAEVDCGYMAFLGSLAIFCVVVLTCWLVSDVYTRVQFHLYGVSVELTITDCATRHSKSRSRPDITYDYVVDGVQYTDSHILDTPLSCKQLAAGNTVDGMYLSYDPQASWVHVPGYSFLSNLCIFAAALIVMPILIGGAVVGVQCLDAYVTARLAYPRLRRSGQLLNGNVIECTGKHHEDSKYGDWYSLTATYSFITPDGQILTRQQSKIYHNVREWKFPDNGAPVKVLYADDNACVML